MRMVTAFFAMGCQDNALAPCKRQLYPPRLLTYSIVAHEQLQVPDRKQLMPLKYTRICD